MANQLMALAEKLEGEYASAKSANIKRYQEALGIYDEIVGMYEPGGGFGAGYEAKLEQTKTRDVGTAIQQNISSGLYGVQTTGGAASRWEAEVGQPARLQLEDVRMGRYGEALKGKAGVIERREDTYPDMGLIASLYSQAAQGNVGMPSMPSGSGSYGLNVPSFSQPQAVSGGTSRRSTSTKPFVPATGTGASDWARGGFSDTSASTKTDFTDTSIYAPSTKGTTGYSRIPTPSEQTTITSNLQDMYPQMYKPGWGTTKSTATYNTSPYGGGRYI